MALISNTELMERSRRKQQMEAGEGRKDRDAGVETPDDRI